MEKVTKYSYRIPNQNCVLVEKYIEEGLEILKVLDKYFPKRFDGKQSIQWLHEHTTQKKQDEWAAFFFEEYSFPLLTRFLGGWKGPRITNNKRFDYQREYVWDLKLEANKDSKGNPSDWVILNDIESTKRVIKLECGLGYIVAMVDFRYDSNGKLRRWRDIFESKKSSKNSRMLKKSGTVTTIKGVFLRNLNQIQKGIDDGWIGTFHQGRNSDGSARDPKYKIKVGSVPKEFLIELE